MSLRKLRQKGFVLMAAGLVSIALMGALGLALDLGRMYVTRSEAQTFVDAAALNGALYLDGSTTGITNARNAALATAGKYEFNSKAFGTPNVEFSSAATGPWSAAGSAPLNSRFVRVGARVSVSLFFLRILTPYTSSPVSAHGVAGQVEKTTFAEGLFPFSPFAKDPTDAAGDKRFGLTPGVDYTLRWPSNVDIDKKNKKNLCAGDRDDETIEKAQAMGGDERGYIEEGSSSVIRDTIENDYMSVVLDVGDLVDFTGGAKQTQLTSLHDRINQDTDSDSATYAQYVANNTGNGRRIVAVPINDGGSPVGVNQRVVGFGAFFLKRTGLYNSGGNQSWCAEYVGAWVQGSRTKGVLSGGTYVVRLVE